MTAHAPGDPSPRGGRGVLGRLGDEAQSWLAVKTRPRRPSHSVAGHAEYRLFLPIAVEVTTALAEDAVERATRSRAGQETLTMWPGARYSSTDDLVPAERSLHEALPCVRSNQTYSLITLPREHPPGEDVTSAYRIMKPFGDVTLTANLPGPDSTIPCLTSSFHPQAWLRLNPLLARTPTELIAGFRLMDVGIPKELARLLATYSQAPDPWVNPLRVMWPDGLPEEVRTEMLMSASREVREVAVLHGSGWGPRRSHRPSEPARSERRGR